MSMCRHMFAYLRLMRSPLLSYQLGVCCEGEKVKMQSGAENVRSSC